MSGPGVTVAVVSFRSRAELPACLAGIESQSGVEVELHVVDNASDDGSVDVVRAGFPHARLVANAANVGFAAANNQVLATATTPYIALVNPDAILPPGALSACIAALEARPGVAAVGTRLVYPDGSPHPSCFGFLTLTNLFGETFGLDFLFPGSALDSYRRRRWDPAKADDIDWIQGAFLVVRTAVVREVGVLDPTFFMYGEEMDWCYRMRLAGWRVACLSEPPVVHIGGASTGTMPGPLFVELMKSRVRFLRKHRGPLVAFAARVLLTCSIALRATYWGGRSVFDRGPLAAQRVRMFRAALGWVAAGLPLSPPSFGRAAGAP